jgi:YggT family protein
MALVVLMKIISGILTVYILLIFVRILLTWFQGPYLGKPVQILHAVTEPYLAWFRRFQIFRNARLDFSPIIGILVLVILQNITGTIARIGTITFGITLGIIVSAIWSAISFILILFIILIAIRLISLFFATSAVSPFWQTLDMIVQPVAVRVSGVFTGNRPLSYQATLGITAGIFLVASIVLRILMNLLISFLMHLPV